MKKKNFLYTKNLPLKLALGIFSFSFVVSCGAGTGITGTTEVKKNIAGSVALIPASQSGDDGIKPVSQHKLPEGVKIGDIKVVKASLDGRELNTQDVSLGSDEKGNIVFFLNKTAFETSFAGKGNEAGLSILNSDVFENTKQEVRTSLLQKYKETLREDSDKQIATPDFLKVKVRGDVLTRLQVASLKKDASKLAKENIFIDRNLYIVLQVGTEKFSVKDASDSNLLITKFNIDGSEIEKTVKNSESTGTNGNLSALPVIAEKVSNKDNSFYENLSSIKESNKVIEIEEIEEALEIEIGEEISGTSKDLREINIPLDLSDLNNIESKKPELNKDPAENSRSDRDENLEQALQKAKDGENKVIKDFEGVNHKPIPDKRLFDPNKILEIVFKDFDNQPAESKFTYSKGPEPNPGPPRKPSNATQEQLNSKYKELDFPWPGNLVIQLDPNLAEKLADYSLIALTNNNTIFPVSTYILKNGYLVMDIHTFKSLKQLKLYLMNNKNEGMLLTISSDKTLDSSFPGTPPSGGDKTGTGKDNVQKVDDNASAGGKSVTSVDIAPPPDFGEAPRIHNIPSDTLKFTLTENVKLTADDIKKLNVYEEIFAAPTKENLPQPGGQCMPPGPPPQGAIPNGPPPGPPPSGQCAPPQGQSGQPPQGQPPQQGKVSGKRIFLPLPEKDGVKQGYIEVNETGNIIGYIAEKDFVKDENTIILEKDK